MGTKAGCKRINVNIPEDQHEKLVARAKDEGIPVTAVINADIVVGNTSK